MTKQKIKSIVLLEIVFFIYSVSSLFSKMATQNDPAIQRIMIFYGLSLFMLGVYAIVWQQILKGMPLSVAYANKGTVIVWGMMWGALIFGEKITIGMVIGSIIIIAGIVIMMTGEKKND